MPMSRRVLEPETLKKACMPQQPPLEERVDSTAKGVLYVVATPIGNMADITLRAIEILRKVDLVAAEDTRHTRRLLSHHDIRKPMVSYHEHNEAERSAQLVARLNAGDTVALVSNAGTPTISDPGYRLVKAATSLGIPVVPIPGVSAAITALSASGLPTDAFSFFGFLSRKKGRRQKELQAIAHARGTLIFYESPKRILDFLGDMLEVLGDRQGVLARELTKRYEEFVYGRLTEIMDAIRARGDMKGECTIVVAGTALEEPLSEDELRQDIIQALKRRGSRISDIARELADLHGLPKKMVYTEALRIKKSIHEAD